MPSPLKHAYKVVVHGQVQGVGFRPFIYRLANQLGLRGEVFNNEEGVVILAYSTENEIAHFVEEVKNSTPVAAKVSEISYQQISETTSGERREKRGEVEIEYSGFTIRVSEKNSPVDLPITPDLGLCVNCHREILDKANRRYEYPFTTCVDCGPRYAITNSYPFERQHNQMNKFIVCRDCLSEYSDPANRRFHSQTNSCSTCGIKIRLKTGEELLNGADRYGVGKILDKVKELLEGGGMVAIKNPTGYLLCCLPNEGTLIKLRQLKKRPTKPFVLLYPNIELIKAEYWVSKAEEEMLLSEVRPIVLLKHREFVDDLVAPGLVECGVMLPSTALLALIMEKLGQPMVATSGNLQGNPIIEEEEECEKILSRYYLKDVGGDEGLAFLHTDLPISFSQDDTLLRFVKGAKDKPDRKMILRRSRGLAPSILGEQNKPTETIIALGADLKSNFTLKAGHSRHLYTSQYLGDLSDYTTFNRYQATIKKFLDIFEVTPDVCLVDAHPQYQSALWGEEWVEDNHKKIFKVPHHYAHFSSVLAEHQLFNTKKKVLGVVWDGMGWGEDGAVWGGEFLVYDGEELKRVNHFEYFKWLAHDRMSKDTRLPLLSLLALTDNVERVRDKFSELEWSVYKKLLENENKQSVNTSSVGRIFDAVASLLGWKDYNSFEGEAAMKVEVGAWQFKGSMGELVDFLSTKSISNNIFNGCGGCESGEIVYRVWDALRGGMDEFKVAASFIYTLARLIIRQAIIHETAIITCSGGVFQNGYLTYMLEQLAEDEGYQVKFNLELPSNDENISFGQYYYYKHFKERLCV